MTSPKDFDPAERKQTDLAEGELDTVEESIRKHDEKHDQNAVPASKKEDVNKDRRKPAATRL